MIVDINSFLNSLAIYMVATAAAQTPDQNISYTNPPRGLWLNKIPWPDPKATQPQVAAQQPIADPVSVIRIYGGAANSNESKVTRSIQCMTTTAASGNEANAIQQAASLYDTLLNPLDAAGVALRPLSDFYIANWKYPGMSISDGQWKIISLDLHQPPGKIGVDPVRMQPLIVFSFDVGFVPVDQ